MILVAAVKGFTNRYFSRLSRYNFNNGLLTLEFYYYDNVVVVDSGITIGVNNQQPRCYMGCEDQYCQIQCPVGIGGPPLVIAGTYGDNGNYRYITLADGSTEVWLMSSTKWRLVNSNRFPIDYWGWGFQTDAQPSQLNYQPPGFVGEYQRYNGWNGINEPPVKNDVFNFYQMLLTTTGVLRSVTWDVDGRSWVHSYMACVGDRVIYQISHDFNNDGKIVGEKGHTYVGYPIFSNGQHRGFVFADASQVIGGSGTFSAMYYYR